MKYSPEKFRTTYEQFPELWDLLSSDEMIGSMKRLSRRAVPAIAALDTDAEPVWQVLEEARQESPLLYDQVKRMIGHMVRQIMESPLVGYEHVRNVPFTSWIFSTGARYRDPAWRRWIYVHRNRDPVGEEMFCLAKTKSLSDLYNPPSNISDLLPTMRSATRIGIRSECTADRMGMYVARNME